LCDFCFNTYPHCVKRYCFSKTTAYIFVYSLLFAYYSTLAGYKYFLNYSFHIFNTKTLYCFREMALYYLIISLYLPTFLRNSESVVNKTEYRKIRSNPENDTYLLLKRYVSFLLRQKHTKINQSYK
jgi:hypothetical protein